MADVHQVARDQLQSFISRIERLSDEKQTIADDIKDVYAEAKSTGFEPKILKKVIAIRHPSGNGRCTWEKTIHIAASANRPGSYSERGEPFTIKGGVIWRKDGPTKCDMVQKKD